MSNNIGVIFLLLMLASSCSVISPVKSLPEDINRTWKFATVLIPANYSVREFTSTAPGIYDYPTIEDWSIDIRIKHLKKDVDKVPVVLHMHGCSGIGTADSSWANFYASLGYLTILPNSFRRSLRKKMCGWGLMDYRAALRVEEINHAKKEIGKIPWVDNKRIVLSGFSEGGNAVSYYNHDGFVTHIIIGTNCRHVGGAPYRPENVPVLNMVGSNDEYDYGDGCIIGSKDGRSRLVVVGGAGHDISSEEEARNAARNFLDSWSK